MIKILNGIFFLICVCNKWSISKIVRQITLASCNNAIANKSNQIHIHIILHVYVYIGIGLPCPKLYYKCSSLRFISESNRAFIIYYHDYEDTEIYFITLATYI